MSKRDKLMSHLQAMMNDFVVGKISPETIELVLGGLNHDTDVADAENLGEVRGKNIRHEERLRKPAGDGLPSMSSANNRQRSRKTEPELGALGPFADYRDSFAGAKRTQMS